MDNKILCLLILISFSILLSANQLYMQRFNDEAGSFEFKLILNNGEIIGSDYDQMDFMLGYQKTGPILQIVDAEQCFTIRDKESLRDVDEIILVVSQLNKNLIFSELRVHEYGSLVKNGQKIEVGLDIEIKEDRIFINEIQPEFKINFEQYYEISGKIGTSIPPSISYNDTDSNTKSIPLKDGYYTLSDYSKSIDYYLVGSYFRKKLDLENKEIAIDPVDVRIRIDSSMKGDITNLTLFAEDEDSGQYEILSNLENQKSASLLDLGYNKLMCSYKKNGESKLIKQDVFFNSEDNEYIIKIGETLDNILLIPVAYQNEKFTLEIYPKNSLEIISIPVAKQKDVQLPTNLNIADIRLINYSNQDGTLRKRVTIKSGNQLEIHDKTKLVIIDLNQTQYYGNKKKEKDFINYLNRIIKESENKNVLLLKYLTIKPSVKTIFNNYNIRELDICEDSDLNGLDEMVVREDNYDAFIANGPTVMDSDIINTFYCLQPILQESFDEYSIKPTSIDEEIFLQETYWNPIKKNIKEKLNTLGFEINLSKYYYHVYYETYFEDPEFNFKSFEN